MIFKLAIDDLQAINRRRSGRFVALLLLPFFSRLEDKEYAKFNDKNLDVYQAYYKDLFQDIVAIGDKAKVPCEFGDSITVDDVQFVDITDGKVDTDEVRLFENVDPFLTYDISSMNRREKRLTSRRDNKRKFEGKMKENMKEKSNQPSRQTTQSPTTKDCMAIVSTFPGFEEGSIGYLEVLKIFLKKLTCQNFMVPKTNETKMEFLKRLIEKEK
ncbi:unnamed protein product [Lactuca saligna]|uniref:Uncharacterized protein n=1 Tax=Lactuca saligna TaxID=75948 RepID=A0AA35W0U0_LACSI|nr:unnamed protein product [Lactuca saligna]